MRATLLFDLDELEDRKSHLRCIKSLDMALSMWTFLGKLRNLVDTSEDGKHLDEKFVWESWNESLEEFNINLEDLIN